MKNEELAAILGRGKQDPTDLAQGIYRIGGHRYQLTGKPSVASIGEARAAKDLDTGEEVFIKVRKPGANLHAIEEEFKLFDTLLDRAVSRGSMTADEAAKNREGLHEFKAGITKELDYRHEAANAEMFNSAFAKEPGFTGTKIRYVNDKGDILIMEKAKGVPFEKLGSLSAADQEAAQIAYVRAMAKQVRKGVYHSDPHSENVFWDPVAKKLQFIDMGSVSKLTAQQKLDLTEHMMVMMSRNPEVMASFMIRSSSKVTSSLPKSELQARLADDLRLVFQGNPTAKPSELGMKLLKAGEQHGVWRSPELFELDRTFVTMSNMVSADVKQRIVPELMAPLILSMGQTAISSPALARESITSIARAIRQSPSDFARTMLEMAKVDSGEVAPKLEPALRSVLEGMVSPISVTDNASSLRNRAPISA